MSIQNIKMSLESEFHPQYCRAIYLHCYFCLNLLTLCLCSACVYFSRVCVPVCLCLLCCLFFVSDFISFLLICLYVICLCFSPTICLNVFMCFVSLMFTCLYDGVFCVTQVTSCRQILIGRLSVEFLGHHRRLSDTCWPIGYCLVDFVTLYLPSASRCLNYFMSAICKTHIRPLLKFQSILEHKPFGRRESVMQWWTRRYLVVQTLVCFLVDLS